MCGFRNVAPSNVPRLGSRRLLTFLGMQNVIRGRRITAFGALCGPFFFEGFAGLLGQALPRRFVGHVGPFDMGACVGPGSRTIRVWPVVRRRRRSAQLTMSVVQR